MYTTILAILAALAAYSLTIKRLFPGSIGWSIFFAFVTMLLVQLIITLILRKRTMAVQAKIQAIMAEIQQDLQRKQMMFQRRPVGSQKMMIQQLLKDQNAGIQRILDEGIPLFNPLFKWNFMLKKQVNAMRMAFLFQQKKYDEVDALMPKCLLVDPQSCCIKMVRMYKRGEDGIAKFYKKKFARARGEQAILPAALYSWILVKQEKYDDAIKVLADAKVKTDSEVLEKNWEVLVNGKYKQFSNAPLGDVWYALQLEEPRMPKQQQVMRYR